MNPILALTFGAAALWLFGHEEKPKRNPARRKPKGHGAGAFQPDLFGGAGIKRPEHSGDRATELAQARREMMDSNAPTLFDWQDRKRNPRRRRRNLDAFTDSAGRVHPIRYSDGYDEARAGEKPLSATRDFDLEAKRVAYRARQEQKRDQGRANRAGLKDLLQERARVKAQLAEVREARKIAKEERIDRPSWAVGWSDEELADFARAEGRDLRSISSKDWYAGLWSKDAKDFRSLSKRGSAKQQIDAQAAELRAELGEIDRLIKRVRETRGRRAA